ncbi:hypothetical protein OIU78_020582 [Salix suchowensis]|nr:hypothetical protein OIU78_020582 [Salix suchowensis]
MASASLVFKKIDSSYSNLLLEHAQQLFSFADAYRGSYSVSIPQVQNYYNSTRYEDELLWAATWLYHASKDLSCLKHVAELNGQQFADWGNPSWFCTGMTSMLEPSKSCCLGQIFLVQKGCQVRRTLTFRWTGKHQRPSCVSSFQIHQQPQLAEQMVVWYGSRNGTACNMLWLLHF